MLWSRGATMSSIMWHFSHFRVEVRSSWFACLKYVSNSLQLSIKSYTSGAPCLQICKMVLISHYSQLLWFCSGQWWSVLLLSYDRSMGASLIKGSHLFKSFDDLCLVCCFYHSCGAKKGSHWPSLGCVTGNRCDAAVAIQSEVPLLELKVYAIRQCWQATKQFIITKLEPLLCCHVHRMLECVPALVGSTHFFPGKVLETLWWIILGHSFLHLFANEGLGIFQCFWALGLAHHVLAIVMLCMFLTALIA